MYVYVCVCIKDKSDCTDRPAHPRSACIRMDKGRRGQDQLPRTMGWPRPMMTLLPLCITFLTLQSVSDAAAVSSQLPTHVLMTAVVVTEKEPLNLDFLSMRWDHDGRPLVEYRDNKVISYEPRALVPLDKFKDGNVSLILINITTSDTGNYNCLIQYNKQQWAIQYNLLVEKHRIKLIKLLSKKVDEDIDKNVHSLVSMLNAPAWKSVLGSGQPFLRIFGYSSVNAKPGDNTSLVCRFHTDPSMELTMLNVRWSKDGVAKYIFNADFLGDQAKVEELSRGYASLNLTSVQRADGGKYVCDIKYRTMEKNLTMILNVKGDEKDSTRLLQNTSSTSAMPTADKYRKEKIGMVVGVIAAVNLLAFIVLLCVAV